MAASRERSPARKAAKVLETIGGVLLCLLVIATPWLFGTTEDWSVRLMNIGSYAAGAIFVGAAICNRVDGNNAEGPERILKYIFFSLNVAVLAFCMVALWNARATFSVEDRSFDYRENFHRSLPTTYDANATRTTLLTLGGCFAVFWSIRYWLLAREGRLGSLDESSVFRNKRFQALSWVLALNGFAIAIQGTLQRLSGSAKLLWIQESYWGTSLACFGPFSYRGNAAQYLNLVWPLALAFWWVTSRERRRRMGTSRLFTDGPELLLIPATVVIIAASVISLSRGGAVVAMGMLLAIVGLFLFQKGVSTRARAGVVVFVAMLIGGVWYLGWEALSKRLQTRGVSDLTGRVEIYRNAKLMAADYPVFGTGPGTFSSVYHMYRQEAGEQWHGFLHDDWMETRVTFGSVGFGLIVLNLLILCFWISSSGRPAVFYMFPCCVVIGLAGALAHAKFDFPFQTYSVFFTFVVISALLCAISPARR